MKNALQGKRILITGPTGQVARPLVAALAPHNEIHALARFSKAEDKASIEALGAHCITADLAGDSLDAVPAGLDYVLNLAVVKSGDFAYDLRANAEGVGRLMLRCRDVKAFLHFSSTAVYEYAGHAPRSEDAPLGDNHRAMFPTYSIAKIAAETVARFTAHEFGIPTTIARLSVPYGNNGGWPFYHLQMMQHGVPIDIHPERPNVYNPLHERDCLAKIPALLEAATTEVTTVNFGGSQAVSIEEWCAYLQELSGFKPVFREDPKAFGSLQIDTTRLHAIAGPTEVDWKQGIREMVQTLAPQLLKSPEGTDER
ncbi:MAG: NAD(P)-dependent oxidoreductase [Gammaproteobacteria bacterium]|nr:NAD(P)-dependent oxidoreductase [Gammaproteobacteria bacterium]